MIKRRMIFIYMAVLVSQDRGWNVEVAAFLNVTVGLARLGDVAYSHVVKRIVVCPQKK